MSETDRLERLRLLRLQVAVELEAGVELDELDASATFVAMAAVEEVEDTEEDEEETEEPLEPELPESRFARELVTASVNSEIVLPQKVIWRLTLFDMQARWTVVSSGVKKAVLQLASAPERILLGRGVQEIILGVSQEAPRPSQVFPSPP